jgi:segregation and condensation protein B
MGKKKKDTLEIEPGADDLESMEGLAPSQQDDSLEIPVKASSDAGLPEYRELAREEIDHFRGLIEAALFVSPDPLSLSVLARQCNLDRVNTRILVDSLMDDYAERDGGILLREISGGYQFVTSDRYGEQIKGILGGPRTEKLSRSVMETLSIICYRQPITLPEVDEVRGVNSRQMIATLLQKKLIKPQGYRPVPGRPTLYVTTKQFLAHFALNSLGDLPPLQDLKELPFDDIE